MASDKKAASWIFLLFRSSLILLGSDVSANINSLASLHRCKDLNRRQTVRSVYDALQLNLPISISYELDEWSQYDNPEEGNAIEGDILENPVSRKTTTTNQQLLWPNGLVRYFVDQIIVDKPAKLAILQSAMKNIMKVSCIKFERIYPESNGEIRFETWVNVTGHEEGCFSDVGRSTFGPSIINLDVRKCFRTRGHALHEILHTLGIFHEHMRPDRDAHIKILWDNIEKGNAMNFCTMDDEAVTDYGLPYDYDSIMHYSMTAFSKNKSLPTIVPRKKGVKIGQRDHLSLTDVQKLLLTYKCNAVDRKYPSSEINRHHRKDVELLNRKKIIRSDDRFKGSTDNFKSSGKSLRKYQGPYIKSTYQKKVPKFLYRKPFSEFYWPLYFPNSLMNDFSYDYNCYHYHP